MRWNSVDSRVFSYKLLCSSLEVVGPVSVAKLGRFLTYCCPNRVGRYLFVWCDLCCCWSIRHWTHSRDTILVSHFLSLWFFVQTATQQLAVFLNVDACTLTVSVFHRPLHIGSFELHFSYSEWICNKDERYVCVFVFFQSQVYIKS